MQQKIQPTLPASTFEYITMVERLIGLIDYEFTRIEKVLKKQPLDKQTIKNTAGTLPHLVSLVDMVEHLRGQGGMFNSTNEYRQKYSVDLNMYESRFNTRLDGIIRHVKAYDSEGWYTKYMHDHFLSERYASTDGWLLDPSREIDPMYVSPLYLVRLVIITGGFSLSHDISYLKETLEEKNIDAIITLGNFSFDELDMLTCLKDVSIPKLGVYGDMDDPKEDYMKKLTIENLHTVVKEVSGIRFGGLEAFPKIKKGVENSTKQKRAYSEKEFSTLLKSMPPVDVFISHTPAWDLCDPIHRVNQNQHGSLSLWRYCVSSHPKYLIHGHLTLPENLMATSIQSPNTLDRPTRIIPVSGIKIEECTFIKETTPHPSKKTSSKKSKK